MDRSEPKKTEFVCMLLVNIILMICLIERADAQQVQKGRKTATLSVPSAPQPLPPRIREMITYFVGGDGLHEKEELDESKRPCMYSLVLTGVELERPALRYGRELKGNIIEPNDKILIGSCFRKKEALLRYPNGTEKLIVGELESDETPNAFYKSYFNYIFDLTDPAGIYTFSTSSGNLTKELQVKVVAPNGPRIHFREGEIMLYHFQPQEKIRLFAYDKSDPASDIENQALFVGWQEIAADETGQLSITAGSTQLERYILIALGEKSGEAAFPGGARVGIYIKCDEKAQSILFKNILKMDYVPSNMQNYIEGLKDDWKFIRKNITGCSETAECDKIADSKFYSQHPELKSRTIREHEIFLKENWKEIRKRVSDCE